jgi:hypothetical protein
LGESDPAFWNTLHPIRINDANKAMAANVFISLMFSANMSKLLPTKTGY